MAIRPQAGHLPLCTVLKVPPCRVQQTLPLFCVNVFDLQTSQLPLQRDKVSCGLCRLPRESLFYVLMTVPLHDLRILTSVEIFVSRRPQLIGNDKLCRIGNMRCSVYGVVALYFAAAI